MRITILGSGGVLGVPVWSCDCDVCTKEILSDKRNIRTRPAILIESNDKKIVVDIGQDFREQMLREKIKKIDYLLLTHTHRDHTASIGELRAAGNVHLEAPQEVLDKLKKTSDIITYLQTRNKDIKIQAFKPKKIGNLSIDRIEVKHEKDYSKDKEPTYGYLFVENNHRVAYIPDFDEIIDKEKVKDLDIFMCGGATFETKWGHVGIQGGIELYKQLKPKLMIFTHLIHSKTHKELEEYVSQFGNIKIAYDGMKIKK